MGRKVFCCECNTKVRVASVRGSDIYAPCPPTIRNQKFFQCVHCGNYVGSYRNGRPLGVIPTRELRYARMKIHALIDPVWKAKRISRTVLYRELSLRLGVAEYHTANIRTIDEARNVYRVARALIREIESGERT